MTPIVQVVNLKLGFPAPDNNVRDWLLQSRSKVGAFTRASVFLCALFSVLLRYLENIDDKVAGIKIPGNKELPESKEGKFRLLMTAGQSFSHQGKPRRDFYDEVLALANEVHLFDDIFT
jgi:hypothetical protein